MKILEQIRTWKNKIFPDWIWSIFVGEVLGLIGVITQVTLLVLVIPFIITVINQFYNKLFKPKDFILRMIVPIILYLIIL